MTRDQERRFGLVKHYGSVLRGMSGWISCHVLTDRAGETHGLAYCTRGDVRGRLTTEEALRLGEAAEEAAPLKHRGRLT